MTAGWEAVAGRGLARTVTPMRAFTLIELLMVVVIVGAMSAVITLAVVDPGLDQSARDQAVIRAHEAEFSVSDDLDEILASGDPAAEVDDRLRDDLDAVDGDAGSVDEVSVTVDDGRLVLGLPTGRGECVLLRLSPQAASGWAVTSATCDAEAVGADVVDGTRSDPVELDG